MLYGGKPIKTIPPSKVCISKNTGFNGPQPYTYSLLAKQPGNDYKIRLRDMERMRIERINIKNKEDLKSLLKHGEHTKMIDVADRKHLYNKIKRMVELEMKANEHLFTNEYSKPELKKEEKIEQLQTSIENSVEEAKKNKQKKDEEERKLEEEKRKLVEEKRLQLFIENSVELRSATIAKRKKDIANINYNIIQERERLINEQKVKNRELANVENLNIIKQQNFLKEEEKRKMLEKKQQFRTELYEQVQQKEAMKKQEKELQKIEHNNIKKLNEELNEEKENEKLELKKKQKQIREEIQNLTDERKKLLSNTNKTTALFDETFAITMRQNLKDDIAEAIDAKIQLKRENDKFMERYAMIKEERKKQSDEISKMVLKQISEIEEFKLSIEHAIAEARQRRVTEANELLKKQLKLREELLEEQKYMKRKMNEEVAKEHEAYLKELKEMCEKKKQSNWQIRKDLSDQIKSREDMIEKQRNLELENHKKYTMEIAEKEKLLKKLLDEI